MGPEFIDKDHCRFRVWAPEKEQVMLHLLGVSGVGSNGMSRQVAGLLVPMNKDKQGYFSVTVEGVEPGSRYFYRLAGKYPGKDLPDPASSYQPQGISGPSEIVDHSSWVWHDENWKGLSFKELIFYEIHVGAFTPDGSFEAIIPRLEEIASLGVNALELMPVAEFPGDRNWGYDGTLLYAVQHNYGGPDGLKKLVDACHRQGIAVFLDVVYNHLGSEGNILPEFGPYFSDKYQTPWGKSFNFDGAWSDGVKEFVLGNILHWANHYHFDGLRLDAVHEMFDRNAVTIWDEMQAMRTDWQQQNGRPFYLVAESDTNDPRTVRPPEAGGKGFDAQWMDDFHHSLYVLLDRSGLKHYYDFGSLQQFARAYVEGFVHRGEYVGFRKRRHGASSAGIPGERFVVFNQNHDLPGNRPGGERLSQLVDLEKLKLAAAAVLLSPYLPLLFMGEEYGEENPFYFFADHRNKELASSLREGRKKEFEAFDWGQEPLDPQDEETFLLSKLDWDARKEGEHAILLEWHRQLLRLRKGHPLLRDLSRGKIRADLCGGSVMAVTRHSEDGSQLLLCIFNFSDKSAIYNGISSASVEQNQDQGGIWTKILDSKDQEFTGRNALSGRMPKTAISASGWRAAPWSASVWGGQRISPD